MNLLFLQRIFPGSIPRLAQKVLLASGLTAILSVAAGLLFWPWVPGLCWFGFFALFSAWNFFGLVRLTNRVIPEGWTRGAGLRTFFSAQLRLFLTGFVVYIAVVWWNVPVTALVTGLTVALLWAVVFGILETKRV